LEGPLLFQATPLSLRDMHCRYSFLPVNSNFEFSSTFSSPAFFRVTVFAVPLFRRGVQRRYLLLLVNAKFEFSSIFSSPAFRAYRFLQPLLVAGRGK